MSPVPETNSPPPAQAQALKEGVPAETAKLTGSSVILHRTPWRPPIAVSGEGKHASALERTD